MTVYRNSSDVWLYVVGSQSENELILVNVLTTLYDSLSSLVGRGERTRRSRRRRPLPARLLTPRARPRVLGSCARSPTSGIASTTLTRCC